MTIQFPILSWPLRGVEKENRRVVYIDINRRVTATLFFNIYYYIISVILHQRYKCITSAHPRGQYARVNTSEEVRSHKAYSVMCKFHLFIKLTVSNAHFWIRSSTITIILTYKMMLSMTFIRPLSS